jgi:hypothetical protein
MVEKRRAKPQDFIDDEFRKVSFEDDDFWRNQMDEFGRKINPRRRMQDE